MHSKCIDCILYLELNWKWYSKSFVNDPFTTQQGRRYIYPTTNVDSAVMRVIQLYVFLHFSNTINVCAVLLSHFHCSKLCSTHFGKISRSQVEIRSVRWYVVMKSISYVRGWDILLFSIIDFEYIGVYTSKCGISFVNLY